MLFYKTGNYGRIYSVEVIISLQITTIFVFLA